MTIDWEKLSRDIDKGIISASTQADAVLASQVAEQTRLTKIEVQQLMVEPGDAQALTRLIAIVKGSSRRNEKIRRLSDESQELGGVIINLLNKLL